MSPKGVETLLLAADCHSWWVDTGNSYNYTPYLDIKAIFPYITLSKISKYVCATYLIKFHVTSINYQI